MCTNTDNGATDPYGDSCTAYDDYPSWCGNYDDNDFTSEQMCCACGGGSTGAMPPTPPTDTCHDTDNGAVDIAGDPCADYVTFPSWCGNYDDNDFTSEQMCCACGGGSSGSVPPSPSPSPPAGTPAAVCTDTDDGATDPFGDGCDAYNSYPSWCGGYNDDDFTSETMCCVCGGGTGGSYTASASSATAAGAKTTGATGSKTTAAKMAVSKKALAATKMAPQGKEFAKSLGVQKQGVQARIRGKHQAQGTWKLSDRLRQIKAAKGIPSEEKMSMIKARTEARKLKDLSTHRAAQKAHRTKRFRALRRLSVGEAALTPA